MRWKRRELGIWTVDRSTRGDDESRRGRHVAEKGVGRVHKPPEGNKKTGGEEEEMGWGSEWWEQKAFYAFRHHAFVVQTPPKFMDRAPPPQTYNLPPLYLLLLAINLSIGFVWLVPLSHSLHFHLFNLL